MNASDLLQERLRRDILLVARQVAAKPLLQFV
jgi:hypothetical protein